jgi:hypothetical protein
MFKEIVKFFDKLEDKVRARLSHRSILYAIVGGTAVVLFWRGMWHTADILMAKGGILGIIFYEPYTIVWTAIILLMTGLFVSSFIGERIILSGIKNEKRIDQKTEEEVDKEEDEIRTMRAKIHQMSKDIEEIKNIVTKNK